MASGAGGEAQVESDVSPVPTIPAAATDASPVPVDGDIGMGGGPDVRIEGRPSFGTAVVRLPPGASFTAEAGAMVAMSRDTDVRLTFAGARGGFFRWISAAITAFFRRILAGESLFVNEFTAPENSPSEVVLAPVIVGDVTHIPLDDRTPVLIQAESYLASSPEVRVGVRWAGLAMYFGGESAFFLRARGPGDLLVNAYGAIEEVEVDGAYIVDTGHVVAFTQGLKYSLEGVGGLFQTVFSGEGLVIRFRGRGKIWMQTRDVPMFVDWLEPYLER
ncbi:MAG: TIGR00266 family protein [Myxococcota bacterium]